MCHYTPAKFELDSADGCLVDWSVSQGLWSQLLLQVLSDCNGI